MELESLKDVRVLLIDDDEDDYLLTKKIFRQIPDSPFTLEWVSTYEEAKKEIDADRHDVYLVDYRLGEHTGLDILTYARPDGRQQPFILLTGVGDSSLEWKSLKMAASDYLVKGSFDATLLSRTIFYSLQRKYIERQRVEHLIELSRSKDEFISIASHQLRTPATAVKQYLGMMLDGFVGELDEVQRNMLKRAYESNERQLRIVSDLLKVAQVDSGKMKLHMQQVNINDLLHDVIADVADTVRKRRQTVEFSKLHSHKSVSVDADAFRMVFENLIDNASKYSPDGTDIIIKVSSYKQDYVRVSIEDQGVGIDPNEADRMFQKFSRINNPLSAKVSGTGLGLYWAKRIIDMHEGTIDYEPNQPEGTRFIIALPCKAKQSVT